MYRTTWLLGLGLLCLTSPSTGCTSDNPNFRPSITFDAGLIDLHVGNDLGGVTSGGDMTVPVTMVDMAKPPPPDLFQSLCTPNTRFCNDNKIIICDGSKYVVERYCPQGSSCKDASCQPPMSNPVPAMSGSVCENDQGPNENFCLDTLALNLSCQPFLVGDDISWQCAGAIGAGTPATPCASGATCRTGFCGSNGTCYRACNEDNDCPSGGPIDLKCTSVNIVVEGHNLSAKSCVPAQ